MKRKKLDSLPKIHRRLYKLWAEAVRKRAGNRCEVDGVAHTKFDTHHIESRNNRALRFDTMNGVLLSASIHKWGRDSFHRSPVWSISWLQKYLPDRFLHVMNHRLDEVNLEDRAVLAELEKKLEEELRS